jgi:hypothetical protein
MPDRVILVFGGGVALTGVPAITRPVNCVPAALVLNVPVELFVWVVLTDCTSVAVMRPPRALKPSTVLVAVDATPGALVVVDWALVSIVPVSMTPGNPTDATLLVKPTGACDVQPSVARAERPDSTTDPTFTVVP